MSRRARPSFSSLALLLAFCAMATGQDNVLIIIADDLGTDYVNVYGEGPGPGPTPNLDALAAGGVLFRNAWAHPTCSPTRSAFHTGRFGYRTGIGAPGGNLGRREVTIAEALAASGSGYAPGYFGKWHLGGNANRPNMQGWSHFAGILGGGVGDYFNWSRVENGVTGTSTTYTTTQIVDDALGWIAGQTTPWACVVAFNAPHTPFHAPPANLHTQNLPGGNPNMNPHPFYRAAVEAMDTEIGRLLSSLGGQLAATNVIFFGDNGTPGQVSVAPFVPSHAKGSAYEGGVGVPFIVSGPAVVAPGREVSALVSAVDVFATIGDLAGVSMAPPFIRQDSVSFAPYLADPTQTPLRDVVYSEGFQSGSPDDNGFAAARDARYKLIRRYGAAGVTSEEFYDLDVDPFETTDLIGALTPSQQAAYTMFDAHILEIRDTAGRFEVFGLGSCTGSNGPPQISGIGTPQVGASYGVRLTNAPPLATAYLTIGVSESFDATFGLTLPFDLGAAGGGAGCFLNTSVELMLPHTASPTGVVDASIVVPNFDVYAAGTVRHSWLVLDPTAPSNPLGLTTTQGLRAILGR